MTCSMSLVLSTVAIVACSEIDACEPYVKYANSSLIPFDSTTFYSDDAQAGLTGECAAQVLQQDVRVSDT